MLRNYLLFKTELFLLEQPDRDIDQWQLGADCAGWFYARLLPVNGIRPDLCPVMEDWGWTFTVFADEVRVCLKLWRYFPVDACWILGIDPKRQFLRSMSTESLERAKTLVCDAIENLLTSDQRFVKHQWYAENPFEVDVREF